MFRAIRFTNNVCNTDDTPMTGLEQGDGDTPVKRIMSMRPPMLAQNLKYKQMKGGRSPREHTFKLKD